MRHTKINFGSDNKPSVEIDTDPTMDAEQSPDTFTNRIYIRRKKLTCGAAGHAIVIHAMMIARTRVPANT
ncbi:MAG: hypothetical protein Rhims3KO_10170 [Hyphomicrobiales bacterium]